jgi:hypothetical protein
MRLISMDLISLVSSNSSVLYEFGLTHPVDVSNPESYEDVVEMLVPVLQERGLMWKDYAVPGGTFRENMHRRPGEPLLPAVHPAAQFRYDTLKANGNTDEHGHVLIDRRTLVEKVVNGVDGLKLDESKVEI